MSLILNIDTSINSALVCVARDGQMLAMEVNHIQKDHAGFLHNAIQAVLEKAGIRSGELTAIAVTKGPGSYTGLRVGMASAKGLAYALNIPLITVSSLQMMSAAMISSLPAETIKDTLFCPMIDARRMEVFTAIYNGKNEELLKATAVILEENSFLTYLEKNKVCFFGNGAAKFEAIMKHPNAQFLPAQDPVAALSQLTHNMYLLAQFSDLAGSDPLYVKEFQSSTPSAQ